MSVAKERIQRLERDMRRLREQMLVLAVALIATLAWNIKQGAPKELTLRRLAIVDATGIERIVAGTRAKGETGVSYFDQTGKLRISTGTDSEGAANLQHFDPRGMQRISVGTGPDDETAAETDREAEKDRIGALTFPDGYSGIALRSSDGEPAWMKTSE